MVMMESSTIIPSTTIRAASVTVFRFMPVRNIIPMATAVHTGTPELAIRADLTGNSRSITKITTSIEMTRSLRNDHTEVPTTLGWSVTFDTLTLSGSVAPNSARTSSTSLPNATMLLSGRISTDIIRAGYPL